MWDVFLSYKRSGEWPTWIKRHFLRLLEHHLSDELGRDAKIFFDEHCVGPGDELDSEILEQIEKSLTVVILWSRQYKFSVWCQTELELFLAKAESSNTNTIFPVVVHDGKDEEIDERIRSIRRLEITGLTNPRMQEFSDEAVSLANEIKQLAASIGKAVEAIDEFDLPPIADREISIIAAREGTPSQVLQRLPRLSDDESQDVEDPDY